jgi:hypothetical protein
MPITKWSVIWTSAANCGSHIYSTQAEAESRYHALRRMGCRDVTVKAVTIWPYSA